MKDIQAAFDLKSDKDMLEENYIPPIVEDVSSDESEYGHDIK